MKKYILLIVIAFNWFISAAQYQFVKQWDKRYGGLLLDHFVCAQKTKDAGFILAGYSESPSGGDKSQDNWSVNKHDFWLVKTDSAGYKEWDKKFGTVIPDYLRCLQQTDDEGFIFGGLSSGISGDKTKPDKGGLDYWVVKIDKYGIKQWDNNIGGSCHDELHSVLQAPDGGYILAGWSCSGISGDKTEPNWDTTQHSQLFADYWIVKLDSLGIKQWDKRYGGVESDVLQAIECTNDKGYILGGYSYSDIGGDKTQNPWSSNAEDYWIVKIDSAGNKQWDKRFGGSWIDDLICLRQTQDGGYILGGFSGSPMDGDKSSNKPGYWLVKIDASGEKMWDKSFEPINEVYSLEQTTDGGYLLGGVVNGFGEGEDKTEPNLGWWQSWVVKVDSLGNKQWDKTIFTPMSGGCSAMQTPDGCYAVANGSFGLGGYKTEPSWADSIGDYWLIKFCMEKYNSIEPKTENLQPGQLQVWPNTFTSDITIALTGEYVANANFTITNLMGQTVYEQKETNLATGYTKMLDLSYLPNGVYFVAVSTGDKTMVERVVKE
ncbi:MAG TPA: T9SS type A sorting domain-containing protein [Chitinophagales bacterium]|nr:T9SS type A sorting domain-containing protein [Chitinophagales bacterium]